MSVNHTAIADYCTAALVGIEAVRDRDHSAPIQEQTRLLPPVHFQGVDIYILDESSQMYTGSFKALTASECISDCLRKGIKEICFTSGANTGMALAAYASKMGVQSHFFIPAGNTWKLDFRYVGSPLCSIYAVKDSAKTKELCEKFAQRTGIPLMPKPEHRLKAAHRRGAFIASLIHEGLKPNWFAQTICAGFGPIGIYDFLLNHRNPNPSFLIPRFLGVQQSGNCSLAGYLQSKSPEFQVVGSNHDGSLIEEGIYDRHAVTYGTFPSMERVLRVSDGAVITVTEDEFTSTLMNVEAEHLILEHLKCNGVVLARERKNGKTSEIVQKAGLLAIAGVMKGVRVGLIPKGEKVLCSFSGGATVGTFQPLPDDHIFRLDMPSETSLSNLIKSVNKKRATA